MTPQLRPNHVFVDPQRCIGCGVCEELAPGILAEEGPLFAEESVLEAMAACPTGAIRWLEREEAE